MEGKQSSLAMHRCDGYSRAMLAVGRLCAHKQAVLLRQPAELRPFKMILAPRMIHWMLSLVCSWSASQASQNVYA